MERGMCGSEVVVNILSWEFVRSRIGLSRIGLSRIGVEFSRSKWGHVERDELNLS